MKIFTVYDSKAEAYLQPIYLRNKAEAIRAFETSCNDGTTQFNKYPEDFTLFEIGEWDESKGRLLPYDAAIPLANAVEFKK